MIGILPTSLVVNDKELLIRSDYRVALLVFEANADSDLSDAEKLAVMLQLIYEDVVDDCDVEEAAKQAAWFLDGGDSYDDYKSQKQLFDWKQDEKLIFSAINAVAGHEVRSDEYIHWWTFLSYFHSIGDSAFSSIVSIRAKKAKGKKLEKYEQEYYREHKKQIDIKPHYTKEELEEIEQLKQLLG